MNPRIEPYFVEREQQRLYELVRNLPPDLRERKLEVRANQLLAMLHKISQEKR